MATDYAVLKKGGFMRQKQKNNFSLRLRVVGGNLTAKQLAKIAEVSDKFGDGYVHNIHDTDTAHYQRYSGNTGEQGGHQIGGRV